MKYVSLFSGIEAASVAWKALGWECVAVSEIEKFPCEVLKTRYPNVPNLGSVTDITEERLNELKEKAGTIDLVVGGSPCQSFSVAGKRLGLEDARGNLMFEYCRIVKAIRPKWFVWENVPGALSSNGGKDFNCLLEEMAQLGYVLGWRVLDAQHFGVPQRRRRVFLVGCLGDDKGPFKVLFERESSGWDSTESAEQREDDSAQTQASIGEHDYERRVVYRKSRRAQSSEDFETWIPTETANTINCFDVGNVRTTHAIIESSVKHEEETVIYTANAIRTGSSIEHTVCPTLRATHSKMGDNFPSIVVEYDVDSQVVTPLYARSGSSPSSDDFAPNLQPKMVIEKTWVMGSSQPNAVMEEANVSSTLTAAMGSGGGHVPMIVDETWVYHSNHRSTPPAEHEKCPTLLAWMGTGGNNIPMIIDQGYYENHPQDSRVKGPCEVAKSVTATYGTGGGNIPFIVEQTLHESRKQRCGYDEKKVCPTLESAMGVGGGNIPLIVQQSTFKERDFGEYRECTVGANLRASGGTLGGGSESLIVQHDMDFDLGGTLTARDHKGISSDDFPVNAQKLVLERHIQSEVIPIDMMSAPRMTANGRGNGLLGDPMFTLTTSIVHAVQVDTPTMKVESKVRRLTPIECERLQGFPDNWTQIEWRGKKAEDCPLSPRYKALGNSMAVPVMQWLGLGIMYAEGMDKPTSGLFKVMRR